MTAKSLIYNAAFIILIYLLYFKNCYLVKSRLFTTLFGIAMFIFEIAKKRSKIYWWLVKSVYDHISPIIFIPKFIKILLAFHFIFNFLWRLFLIFLALSIIFETLYNIFLRKTTDIKIDKIYLKYTAIILLFTNYEFQMATTFAASLFLIDLLKKKIFKEILR